MDHKNNVLFQRYEIGRLLGQGAFAKVYYARSFQTGQSVAIKVIDKERVMMNGITDQIKREISVMRLVRHPNIIFLYEVMATKDKIYYVMEYAKGGELFNKVVKGKLQEDVARKYFQQLINAVDFCHSRAVYHRDLKPENILLDENENLKVSDFGLSALAESRRQDGLLHTTCGSPAYVSPEVINQKGYDGAKADVWSCGIILFILLAGYLPFYDSNLMELYRKIMKAKVRFPSWFRPEVRRLLLRILDPNPESRISIARIKESAWFRRGLSLKSRTRDTESGAVGSSDLDASSFQQADGNMLEEVPIPRLTILNAFDIISLLTGFEASTLFEAPCPKAQFISCKPASVIISKLEELAERTKLKMSKKGGIFKFDGSKEGRKGILSIDAEIFAISPTFHMVEVKKTSGDTFEYQNILDEIIRPGFQDIVWTESNGIQPHIAAGEDPTAGEGTPSNDISCNLSDN